MVDPPLLAEENQLVFGKKCLFEFKTKKKLYRLLYMSTAFQIYLAVFKEFFVKFVVINNQVGAICIFF